MAKSKRKKNKSQQGPQKEAPIELEGEVTDISAGENFTVSVGEDHEVLCKLSGKMRKNRIRIVVGDQVKVEVTPYDPYRGRITFRKK